MVKSKLSDEIACKEETCVQKTNIALINQTMENIDKELQKINAKLDNMETHYANKWVERVMVWIMGIIGTSLVGAVLALILK